MKPLRFTRRQPTPSEASAVLNEFRCLNYRERVKARARLMRQQMGLPHAPELDPRT